MKTVQATRLLDLYKAAMIRASTADDAVSEAEQACADKVPHAAQLRANDELNKIEAQLMEALTS